MSKLGYNPQRDVQPVEQFGYVNLVDALANNCLPADAAGAEANYNDIEDPSSIMQKPSDIFDSFHQERTIRDYKPATPKEENPA